MVDIAFDSSILIEIGHLIMDGKKYPRKKQVKPLLDVKNMILNGEINAIVTQKVYKEIKRGKSHDNGLVQNFINSFCEVLQPTQYEQDKALCVTDAYGNYLIEDKTAIYLAEDYTQKNYDDATIIAEVSVEQKMRKKLIPFVTANTRDVDDINRINKVNVRHDLPEIFICSLSRFKDAIYFAKREDKEFNNKTI